MKKYLLGIKRLGTVKNGVFNNQKTKIFVIHHHAKNKGEIKIKVRTQYAKLGPNSTFSTIPIVSPDKMKMVLRWDMGVTLNLCGHDIHGPHVIFANKYNFNTWIFHCVNNWSDNIDTDLTIANSKV